jgi:hypothetical protein
MRRNLIYNCCALRHSEEWKLNVERLCSYPDAFNGRRLVIIKTGSGIAAPHEVEEAFAPLGECEFIHWQNDRVLQEVAGFVETLALLESIDPNEMTFYAHTKGVKYRVRRRKRQPRNCLERMSAIRWWRDRMYDELLSDIPRVEQAAASHPAVGCFRKNGHYNPLPPESRWHFSGTFWWLRHDQLFARDWRGVDRSSPFGIEAYPGTLFRYSESVCLYGDEPDDLYRLPEV